MTTWGINTARLSHIQPFKRLALNSVSPAAVGVALALCAPQALAQTPAAAQAAQASSVEEIVVTGTRIVRDGYEAPTPLTVMGVEQIQAMAPPNIADAVNALPQFAGGQTPHANGQGIAGANDGLNNINLRGLGATRTLVLLDGQRVSPSGIDGAVDINGFPHSLVSRIDVVTGGASAAYGSDAVSGVVNFVLDKTFVGLKGEVAGSITTYGDDAGWKVSLTGGTAFGGGRGHFILSGELNHVDGIIGPTAYARRSWSQSGDQIINNPAYTATNGQPRLITASHVGAVNATPGGIIISGPLKGIYFGQGGVPAMFNYGSLADSANTVGGDWQYANYQNRSSLDQRLGQQSLFTRISYDITDNIQVFAMASYANTHTYSNCCLQFNIGNLVIKPDNAFIPASVAAQVTALKLTQLQYGTMNQDVGTQSDENYRRMNRYVVGANGKVGLFDSTWNWDAYYQKGISLTVYWMPTVSNNVNYTKAIDAVRNAQGLIVCRSTLTNPGDGCVPWNVFGTGVNGQAAYNYIHTGLNKLNQHFEENVMAASIRGEPFSNWAGPVSLATGIEHRTEMVRGMADPLVLQFAYFTGNYQPTNGKFNVTEGFVESVVPLAKDTVWAKSLDLNAAARFTGYSTSGFVTTWKVGATYSPIDDIRLRATRSRDIRAPNLGDLYLGGVSNDNTIIDPTKGGALVNYRGIRSGNPLLKPEKADTTGLGVVLQPQFFPGFSASFDYYSIKIDDAIGTLGFQAVVDRCYLGNQDLCNSVSRDANGNITIIRSAGFNYLTEKTRGYDIEASYRGSLETWFSNWGGDLTLRALITRVISRASDDGLGLVTETAGQNGAAGPLKWRYHLQATYANDPFSVTLTGRGLSGGTYNNFYVECSSACPATTTLRPTINNNHIDGTFYVDLSLNYKLKTMADDNYDAALFLAIKNLANTPPVVRASGPSLSYTAPNANFLFYDAIGREFRAGVRFKM